MDEYLTDWQRIDMQYILAGFHIEKAIPEAEVKKLTFPKLLLILQFACRNCATYL